MKDTESKDPLVALRERIEESLRREPRPVTTRQQSSPEESQKLVHELQVHQIELEAQNEELKRTQQLLVEAVERYSDLYDFAPVGYFTLDENGLILDANLTGAALLAVEQRSMIGKPFQQFLMKSDTDTFFHYKQKILAGGVRLLCEVKLKKRNGDSFDAQLEGRVLGDTEAEKRKFRVIVSDITNRKKAEEELRQKTERLREYARILEQTQIMVKDMDNRIVYWNEGAERLYGFTRSQAVGRIAPELLRTECSESLDDVRAHLLSTGKWQGEFRHRKADGEQIVVASHVTLIRDNAGVPKHIIKSDSDITDLKRTEQALKESEELFHAVFESTGDSIYLKDRSFRFIHVNNAMCRLVGLPAEAIIGKTAEDIHGAEIGNVVNDRESRVLGGESIDVEHKVTVDGTVLTFHDSVVPLENLEGNIVGVYCVSRNVTDRKMAAARPISTDRSYPSPAMQKTYHDALYAARSDSIILLLGESGSGKDHLARWIHDRSNRAAGPFFTVNCAALPLELAESELFGHERGAFTGAQGMKRGLLELAEGGTILLNEIGELSTAIQSKLLAFLDTRSFVRVGGQEHIHVDARLLAATHRDLREEVAEKRFLEPLFYRLSVFPIRVPALRERLEDLPILVEEIIATLVPEIQLTELPVIESSVLERLSNYSWPGNVRELRNVLERSLMLWEGGPLPLDLPGGRRADGDWSYVVKHDGLTGLQGVVDDVAYALCEHMLRLSGGNKKEAAKSLQISRDTLYRYLRKMERKRKNMTPRHVVSEKPT